MEKATQTFLPRARTILVTLVAAWTLHGAPSFAEAPDSSGAALGALPGRAPVTWTAI